jgi:hypothetical protein
MANVIFAGQGVGAIVLPLMLFHQIQLMVCAMIAQKYAKAAHRSAAQDAESADLAAREAEACRLQPSTEIRTDRRVGDTAARSI